MPKIMMDKERVLKELGTVNDDILNFICDSLKNIQLKKLKTDCVEINLTITNDHNGQKTRIGQTEFYVYIFDKPTI